MYGLCPTSQRAAGLMDFLVRPLHELVGVVRLRKHISRNRLAV